MTVIAMSRKEIDRMHVLRDLDAKRITTSEAAQLMQLTRRQVFRLVRRYRRDGPAALVSSRRGRPSNRSYPAVVRTEALALIKSNYADFGPTLAAEKLAERHGLRLGVETIRRWMLAEGIWKDRKQRLPRVYQPRYRRECLGELIQIDGSEHWWFEGRGPQCTLLAFIDDATSRIMHASFSRKAPRRRGQAFTVFEEAVGRAALGVTARPPPQARRVRLRAAKTWLSPSRSSASTVVPSSIAMSCSCFQATSER